MDALTRFDQMTCRPCAHKNSGACTIFYTLRILGDQVMELNPRVAIPLDQLLPNLVKARGFQLLA